jgi:hypothetical protein
LPHKQSFLPDEQFPQFEAVWAQALLDSTSQLRERALGSLLIRFGTGAATSQMIAKLDAKRSYPCDAHVVALGYLVKFKPELARQRLRHEVETNEGGCGTGLLRWISELTVAPVLNDLALENLNSPDPGTVIEAVRYLTPYGRKQDEPPLWQRYVEWTSAYKGKADLLDKSGPGRWDKNFASSNIGEELGNALIRNQGWVADSELVARVLERCVGDSMCKRLKDDARWTGSPYQLSLPQLTMPSVGLGSDGIGVAQYGTRSLKLFEEKISQFPPGSTFIFPRWYRPANSDEQKIEGQVRTILEKHGMSLDLAQQ